MDLWRRALLGQVYDAHSGSDVAEAATAEYASALAALLGEGELPAEAEMEAAMAEAYLSCNERYKQLGVIGGAIGVLAGIAGDVVEPARADPPRADEPQATFGQERLLVRLGEREPLPSSATEQPRREISASNAWRAGDPQAGQHRRHEIHQADRRGHAPRLEQPRSVDHEGDPDLLVGALGMTVIDCGNLPDDPDQIGEALERAAAEADCIVTAGGVSVGEEDHVKSQIEQRGALDLWKLAIKPGKPLAFGQVDGTPIFGLPGNPVSSMVCGHVFLTPVIRHMLGLPAEQTRRTLAPLACAIARNGPREHYMRASFSNGQLTPFDRQDSALLSVLAQANALLVRPPHAPALGAGAEVPYILL